MRKYRIQAQKQVLCFPCNHGMTLAKNETIIARMGQVEITRIGCRGSGSDRNPIETCDSARQLLKTKRDLQQQRPLEPEVREKSGIFQPRKALASIEVHCQDTAEMGS